MQHGKGVVVIGGGQGAIQLARTLRELGYDEPIRIICDEALPPYQRPPLSKTYLAGDYLAEDLLFADRDLCRDEGIELIHERAAAIEPGAVRLSGGLKIAYGQLVMATGASNRRLVSESGQPLAHSIRTIDDADRLREALAGSDEVTIIGAGFLGLEIAAICAGLGHQVHVAETQSRVMARTSSVDVSQYARANLEAKGVSFSLGLEGVRLSDRLYWRGGERATGLTVACIGVVPNAELGLSAGWSCPNGFAVDSSLAIPGTDNVHAIGDCAYFPSQLFGGGIRLESVQNAVDQAIHVAHNIMGRRRGYDSLPWFWSEQGGMRLQIVGDCRSEAQLRCGAPESDAFSILHFRADQLIGVESVNQPRVHFQMRKMLAAGQPKMDIRAVQAQLERIAA